MVSSIVTTWGSARGDSWGGGCGGVEGGGAEASAPEDTAAVAARKLADFERERAQEEIRVAEQQASQRAKLSQRLEERRRSRK